MTRFLLLQLRPETEASDDEYRAFLDKGGLEDARVHRIRLDRQDLPPGLDPRDYAGVIVGGGPGCVSDDPATKDPVEARIEAACLPENKPSRDLLEKCGFKYEGVAQSYLQINGRWRTHVLYAQLRMDRRGRTDAG